MRTTRRILPPAVATAFAVYAFSDPIYRHRQALRDPTLTTSRSTAWYNSFTVKCEGSINPHCGVEFEQGHTIMNWSSTHEFTPRRTYLPKSSQEVVRVLQIFDQQALARQNNNKGINDSVKIRPVGGALSPNGLGLHKSGASVPSQNNSVNAVDDKNLCSLSVSNLDYVRVDTRRQEVTVGAGATVRSVLSTLAKHGLTLSNFSSIQEQQIGGWTQVSAHGTGLFSPPVDEMVVRMQLATPTEGLITLSDQANKHLFRFAKVGLGCLGVVTELTLKCMPQTNLHEQMTTFTRDSIAKDHKNRLTKYRHVRYMWIPYTDCVVSVVSNPTTSPEMSSLSSNTKESPTKAMVDLVRELGLPATNVNELSFSQLRDILLDYAPLDVAHIQRVNAAEAKFWTASTGDRIADSTQVLGFDCGGEQWVWEVCLPLGKLDDAKDMEFMRRLLKLVEDAKIPAPSPIEQRWCARSSAFMSPAYSEDPNEAFTWMGIIMYLPPGQSPESRAAITRAFDQYCALVEPLVNEFHGQTHWAKIELPGRGTEPCNSGSHKHRLQVMQRKIQDRYPVKEFNELRKALDPRNILGNDLIDTVLKYEASSQSK